MNLLRIVLLASATAAATPASASELFGGLFVHDVKSPLTKSGIESGLDLQIGYRGGAIGRTPLQPYGFLSANSPGNTHFAAVGLSARFGNRWYVRPGLGLAVHTGSAAGHDRPGNDKIEFGSRVLFEPELGVGTRLTDRISIEASWVHLSHAQLFGGQNPGIDNIGARLSVRL